MDIKNVSIFDMSVSIPNYYQQVDSMPDDPVNSLPFMVRTNNAECFVLIFPIHKEESLPNKQENLIMGIRHYLGEHQGIIQVEANQSFAYSIVKTLKDPIGVQYALTYQKFFNDITLNIQAFFDEIGTTGIRDSIVYDLLRKQNAVGTDNNPFDGWSRDPYDISVKNGALMNLSEQEIYDDKFRESPLSMCRELIKTLIK